MWFTKFVDRPPAWGATNGPSKVPAGLNWRILAVFLLITVRLPVMARTVNALVREIVSDPVVTTMSRAPKLASHGILMFAIAVVELTTVNELTLTPVPKVASVVPETK